MKRLSNHGSINGKMCFNPLSPFHCNRGFSLVQALVVIALLGIFLMVATKSIIAMEKTSVRLKIATETMALKQHLTNSIDCESSFQGTCQVGEFVEVKGFNRTGVLIPKYSETDTNPSKIGRFRLRALCLVCANCPNGLKLAMEYTLKSDPGPNSWKDLYDGVPAKCEIPDA